MVKLMLDVTPDFAELSPDEKTNLFREKKN